MGLHAHHHNLSLYLFLSEILQELLVVYAAPTLWKGFPKDHAFHSFIHSRIYKAPLQEIYSEAPPAQNPHPPLLSLNFVTLSYVTFHSRLKTKLLKLSHFDSTLAPPVPPHAHLHHLLRYINV